MSQNGYVPVCRASDLPEQGKTVVEVGDRLIALFHVSGTFWAIDDLCTHDGGPLADGDLHGHTIICRRHGAKFDVRTGRVLAMPATQSVAAYPVKVENGEVYVKVGD